MTLTSNSMTLSNKINNIKAKKVKTRDKVGKK